MKIPFHIKIIILGGIYMEPILDFQTSNQSFTDFYDKMRKKDISLTEKVLWLYHKGTCKYRPS